jgi:hypothetical protein
MGDFQNKYRKDFQAEQTRLQQARGAAPTGGTFVPVCAGCGLEGLNNPSPKGFGFLRMYAVADGWKRSGKFYCENCLEAHTGEKPHGD